MITEGTKVRTKKQGTGTCLKVDSGDSFITYYCSFSDGTHVWLSQPRSDGSYAYLVGRNAITHHAWGVFSCNLEL